MFPLGQGRHSKDNNTMLALTEMTSVGGVNQCAGAKKFGEGAW